jgi:hypothetical protein
MLDTLFAAEAALPALLAEPGWQGLHVDYHPPRVDRVWRAWGAGHRIYLHRIHPCAPGEALFHPHPWPSAMRVVDGRYEMAIGYGATRPPIAARVIAGPSTAYDMTAPDAWHSVRPLDGPSLSLMVTGRPWDRASPKSEHPLPPMAAAEIAAMLECFHAIYG